MKLHVADDMKQKTKIYLTCRDLLSLLKDDLHSSPLISLCSIRARASIFLTYRQIVDTNTTSRT